MRKRIEATLREAGGAKENLCTVSIEGETPASVLWLMHLFTSRLPPELTLLHTRELDVPEDEK